ncbi:MAG: hypothetical protein ABI949_00800 [Ilumatobacteraceae bacterium]
MKKMIFVGAFALLAACGGSDKSASGPAATANTSPSAGSVATSDTTIGAGSSETTIAGSGDTITVDNFGDMPPKCIELLGQFLKQIEPTVSKIDWDKATLGDFETFGQSFQAESDSFDKETTAAGCDKYNLQGSDEKQFEQMAALAAKEAPGTVGFIKFLNSLSATATATAGSVPADCKGTIAEIDTFVSAGGTMKGLTMVQVTRLGQLMTAIRTICTSDESTAFFSRADVNAFISGS